MRWNTSNRLSIGRQSESERALPCDDRLVNNNFVDGTLFGIKKKKRKKNDTNDDENTTIRAFRRRRRPSPAACRRCLRAFARRKAFPAGI